MISAGVSRPSITSSLEKPKKKASLRSISVTRTASALVSERRLASSSPPNPAPRITTFLLAGSHPTLRRRGPRGGAPRPRPGGRRGDNRCAATADKLALVSLQLAVVLFDG